MAIGPIKNKPPSSKSQTNLLEQMGQALKRPKPDKQSAKPPTKQDGKNAGKQQALQTPVGTRIAHSKPVAVPSGPPKNAPVSGRQAYSDRVRREGTELQLEQARAVSLRIPKKTEFKQGKANELEGLSNDVQLNIRKMQAFGSSLAHSRIIGVAQVGEGIGMATDAVKGLHGAIRGTPQFLRDASDLITGRVKVKPGEIDAGKFSGAGKFAWGAGSGLVDIAARAVVPGRWRDGISEGMQKGQQALDDRYRGAVKKIGIDPDSKAYGFASTATQVVASAVTMKGGGHLAAKGAPLRAGKNLVKVAKPTTALDEVLAQVNKDMQRSDFKNKLAKSNSPAEIQRQNKAIQAMRADGKITASLIQPEGAVPPLGRVPKRSDGAMAIKMRYFANTVKAIANNTLFDNYLSALHGKSVQDVVKGGSIFNKYIDEITEAKFMADPNARSSVTIGELSARYRKAKVQDLPAGLDSEFLPQSNSQRPSPAHNTHTAFGAVSKVGEVMANTDALSLDLKLPPLTSWANRGLLPGKGTDSGSFWKIDAAKEWGQAEKALAGLEKSKRRTSAALISGHVQELMGVGLLPKGSALGKLLEHLETKAFARDKLNAEIKGAASSDRQKLRGERNAAKKAIARSLGSVATSTKQTRAHVMNQSFGTPATTYALTTRHAAAARYMQSIEGQTNAVFDANKFRRILKAVELEAGPASTTGPQWHKQMLRTYSASHFFQDIMKANPAMQQAWLDYRAQFGVK